ncbi:MAG: S8 family serine peptidase [Nitrosopumilus sp.]
MRSSIIFSITFVILSSILISQIFQSENEIRTYIENSVPYVGTEIPRTEGLDGSGIRVAVIDTGVDFNHPDLLGWGPDGKVIGGYNFIQTNQLPMDKNGHGTKVAGIIAADGSTLGIAPKAKILAYKVSEDGEGVSSELISSAIEKAIEDKADIINISLGVNKTNSKIDSAVDYALEKGIFVVTAAGNDGPELKTIGSPGRNFESLTVGATYNNMTSSLIATLEIDEKQYTAIPMVGAPKTDEPITGKVIFGGFGKISDLENLDVKDAILIVERGSDVEGELLFFSIKEKNSADAGAKALIVYNNEPGIFLGELIHEFSGPEYSPQIPVVSVDREEGLEIVEKLENESDGILHLFYNPDFIAHFSSRGPVSPFYMKPDMVAPGAYINTTNIGASYNFTSGTSFAAPHVSGAAALLLQNNPELENHELKSLLTTTVKPVTNAYGKEFSIHESGSGRLDIESAYNAKLIISPTNFVINFSSDEKIIQKELQIKLLEKEIGKIDVKFEGPEFIKFENQIKENNLQTKFTISGEKFGQYEGKIFIIHEKIEYTIPIIIHYTEGSISAFEENEKLFFEINHPDKWSFTKITVTNSKNGNTETLTATPEKNPSMKVYENGQYWIEAKIISNGNTTDAFDLIKINTVSEKSEVIELRNIPEKQIIIIISIVAIVGIIGLLIKR